jgi:hypothetical protein
MKLNDMKSIRLPALVSAAVLVTFVMLTPAYCQTDGTALLLEMSPAEGGKITPGPGVHQYDKDADVVLTAVPNPGYQFVYWLGDVSDSTASTTIVYLNSPKIVIAVFERARYEYMDIVDRAQLSLGRGELIPTGPDYARTEGNPGGGRRPPKIEWPKPPKEPEFPVPEKGEPELPVPVPEPATAVLLAFGALLAVGKGQRTSAKNRRTHNAK